MTQISSGMVAHLATLSSIALDEAELKSLQADIDAIVEHITALGELNTEGVEPTYQVTDLSNVFRNDIPDDGGVSGEALVALAPEYQENQIKVPKVL